MAPPITEQDRAGLESLMLLEQEGMPIAAKDLGMVIHPEPFYNVNQAREVLKTSQSSHPVEVVRDMRAQGYKVNYDRLLALTAALKGDRKYQALDDFLKMQGTYGVMMPGRSIGEVLPNANLIMNGLTNTKELFGLYLKHKIMIPVCCNSFQPTYHENSAMIRLSRDWELITDPDMVNKLLEMTLTMHDHPDEVPLSHGYCPSCHEGMLALINSGAYAKAA